MTPQEFADGMNNLTPEEIERAMASLPQHAKEWGQQFEALGQSAEDAPTAFCPPASFWALVVLDYLSDLFTGSPKEVFTREEVLVALNAVKHDPEMFSPDIVAMYEQGMEDAGVNRMIREDS